jgi:flagellar biosynthetic protein FliQ
MMHEAVFFDTLRQGLWIAVSISAPMLAVALVAGLVIGLFQALTSIQEMTLTFVPKVGAMMIVFWVSMTFMSGTLVAFFTDRIIPLIAGS